MPDETYNLHPRAILAKADILPNGVLCRPITLGQGFIYYGDATSVGPILGREEPAAHQRNSKSREIIRRDDADISMWTGIVVRCRPTFDTEGRRPAVTRERERIRKSSVRDSG